MNFKRHVVLGGFLTLIITIFLCGSAFAYTAGAVYTWGPATPNYNPAATLHPGTINTNLLTVGDFLGVNTGTPFVGFGSSGSAVGWDDTWVGGVGNGNTNGDSLDGLWVQIFSTGGWWDLGAAYSTVAVFTSQDHGPYLGEGTEYRVFGTNTLWDISSLSAQAVMTDVYLDGWRTHNPAEDINRNLWLSDDITGVFNLGGSYQYIRLVAWGGGTFTEPEIDAVAGVDAVPIPAAIWLFGSGLIGMLGFRKKFKG